MLINWELDTLSFWWTPSMKLAVSQTTTLPNKHLLDNGIFSASHTDQLSIWQTVVRFLWPTARRRNKNCYLFTRQKFIHKLSVWCSFFSELYCQKPWQPTFIPKLLKYDGGQQMEERELVSSKPFHPVNPTGLSKEEQKMGVGCV